MVKRKYDDDSLSGIYDNKSRARQSVEARVDPTYGQRSALPGLDDEISGEDDDLNYGNEMDALAYLRAVRQEATTIPNLLVAPAILPSVNGRDIYENGIGDFRGRYEDGAYFVSWHDEQGSGASNDIEEEDPQLAYFDSILARYEILRSRLQQKPPFEVVQNLGKDYPTYLGPLNKATAKWWLWKMRTSDPKSAQIASMDKGTVLRLLGLITQGSTLKRGSEIMVGISTWVWSLLARLPDRGELTSEEIGVVRELGKKALLVRMGLQKDQNVEKHIQEVEAGYDSEVQEEDLVDYVNDEEIQLDEGEGEDVVSEGEVEPATATITTNNITTPNIPAPDTCNGTPPPVDSTDLDSLAALKARLLERLHNQEHEVNLEAEILTQEPASNLEEESPPRTLSKWNTLATVDIIITIAGEVYGQRDLLEFRGAWGE